ncbi:MAG: acetylornithine deacetylase [Gammaproteobacteria bacterium]
MADKLPKLIDSFSGLIALPSVSSIDPRFDMSNRAVVELLADWLENLGFEIELIPVNGNPEKLNLIACAGVGDGGLVLSGHTDTVPYDELAWQQDPFRLTEKNNRLYGLGSSDMKCFFPIVIEALKKTDLAKLKYPLYVLATCDEESTMSGARALRDANHHLGRHALIGEPTGLRPVIMHKGIVMESIKLIGRAGHASDPSLGVNALEGMHAVITHLLEWRQVVQSERQNPAFKVPVSTLNFGSIHGGDSPNRICADCEMSVDLRLLPDMDLDETRAAVRKSVMQAIDGMGLSVEFDSIIPGLPAMETATDAEIVKLAERLTGVAAGTVAFGTEGPYLNELGMETVVLGPGDIDQAHQANEYLPMDRIDPMLKILSKMIEQFCMKETENAA